jgi:uncharacterized protein
LKPPLLIIFIISLCLSIQAAEQAPYVSSPASGFEERIRQYVDTLTVFDTHEHFLDPALLKGAGFLDFSLFFLENGFHDLVSAGMSPEVFSRIFSERLDPQNKWKFLEPYWKYSFNTANSRVIIKSISDLYGVSSLTQNTVVALSNAIKKSYSADWFSQVIRSKSKIDYLIMDGPRFGEDLSFVKYAGRFNPWLSVETKHVIDSLALNQNDPIYSLDDFVKSMVTSFEKMLKEGMVVVKINSAYARPIKYDKVTIEAARKVFRTLVNGNDDTKISFKDARPLQDYMLYQLIATAQKQSIPVAFHTGIQAGSGNNISNSDPVLLTDIFMAFPSVKFVLFHGAYPYGGELSVLAKTFRNVYIDMNWIYSISPSYAERYLDEWLETVPASKIMAFGGDQVIAEMTYGSLVVAREIVADVLVRKVSERYFTEDEAKRVAKMILHDNGLEFYNLK